MKNLITILISASIFLLLTSFFTSNTDSPIDISGINVDVYQDLQYGATNREVLDIFVPTDEVSPTGIVIEIHAGGFYQWDKSRAYDASGETRIRQYLTAGVAYATINYPYVTLEGEEEGYIKCFEGGAHALQFIKYHADKFNIDKTKVILKGTSAGASIAAWIAYGDDLADAGNVNLALRESTSVKGIALRNPQASYDILKWETVVFASLNYNLENDYYANPESAKGLHRNYGISSYDEFLFSAPIITYRQDLDMLQFIEDNNGKPTYINCPNTLYSTLNGSFSINDISHSPYHGLALKTALNGKGTEVVSYLNGLFTEPSGEIEYDFVTRIINQ
tara:strand:+ start:2324 stop:3328 length:1005 start_codon:yes stop_codon:yes gene_type:complete